MLVIGYKSYIEQVCGFVMYADNVTFKNISKLVLELYHFL